MTKRHYYSYTAALGVTLGIGCLLLTLNMIIYGGIYYQRRRDRQRRNQTDVLNPNNTISVDILSQSFSPQSTYYAPSPPSIDTVEKDLDELPPLYSIVRKSRLDNTVPLSTHNLGNKEDHFLPAIAKFSSVSNRPIKKRVQIQEISL